MSELTQKYLKKILHYDQESGVFTWKVNRGAARVGYIAGGLKQGGYIEIKIKGKMYKSHRLAWFYVHGSWPSDQIDHINGVRDDNRICNLRSATNVENCRNQRMYRNNKSGVKGVSWHKPSRKWLAMCTNNGKRHHLGVFTNISDAEQAIKDFRECHHGEFANHENGKRYALHNIPPEILTLLGIYPGTTGRVMLYVENGVITSNLPIPDHHFCCSVESFVELAQRAGWHVSPERPDLEVANVA